METLKKVLIFRKMGLFYPSSKNKKNPPRKNFLKKKLFLCFRKQKPPKNFLYFIKENFFCILGNGNLEKIPYI